LGGKIDDVLFRDMGIYSFVIVVWLWGALIVDGIWKSWDFLWLFGTIC
jgi:hypothetical protein